MKTTLTKQMIIDTIDELLSQKTYKRTFYSSEDFYDYAILCLELDHELGSKYGYNFDFKLIGFDFSDYEWELIKEAVENYYYTFLNETWNTKYNFSYNRFRRVVKGAIKRVTYEHTNFDDFNECYDYFIKLVRIHFEINEFVNRPLNAEYEPDFNGKEWFIIKEELKEWYDHNNSKLLSKAQRLLNNNDLDKIKKILNSDDKDFFLGGEINTFTKVYLLSNLVTLLSPLNDNDDFIYMEGLQTKILKRYINRV